MKKAKKGHRTDRLLVFSGTSNLNLAKEIVKHAGVELADAFVGKFPEGEIRVMSAARMFL